MKRITTDIGIAFHTMKDTLRNAFLLDLFNGYTSQIIERAVTGLSVKQDGIALSDPNQISGSNWTYSCVITGHIVAALRGTAEFWSRDHALLMGEGRYEIQRRHTEATETATGEAQDGCATRSSWTSLMGTRPRSLRERSLVCQSSRMGLLSQTLIRPPEPTGHIPVSSQDTLSQRSAGRLSFGQGIMPY